MSGMLGEAQWSVMVVVMLGIILVTAFAFVDAVSRPARAFVAADKLTKQGWLMILGLSLVVSMLPFGGFLRLIALVAALVYILDARPALQSVTRRR